MAASLGPLVGGPSREQMTKGSPEKMLGNKWGKKKKRKVRDTQEPWCSKSPGARAVCIPRTAWAPDEAPSLSAADCINVMKPTSPALQITPSITSPLCSINLSASILTL